MVNRKDKNYSGFWRLHLLAFSLGILFSTSSPAQQRVDGYRGIWFTLGQMSQYGDKYSGGLGTYTANHLPVAIYSPEVRKTFFVYGGTTKKEEKHLLIMLSYFDHEKMEVPKPVIVYDKMGVNDPHDNASLSLDEDGYLWVFVSGRNTARPGIIFRGTKPFDITSFEKIKEGEMTYPQPWRYGKQFTYLFTKYTRGRELYWSNSADGRTWTPEKKLAGMGGHYQVSNLWKDKLVTAFNYHPGGNVDKRTNIYLAQTVDQGNTWTTIDGKVLTTPLTNTRSEALVKNYETEGRLVYLNDLSFDKDGNPVILAVLSRHHEPGPQGGSREWTIFHWKNSKWNISKITESSHNYDMGSLYINGDDWEVIGPTEPGKQRHGTGGEMVFWKSSDEGKTWKGYVLTLNSPRNHSFARRPLNAHDDFYCFWADGNADQFSESRLYFCNKAGELFILPYDMDRDLMEPERFKGIR